MLTVLTNLLITTPVKLKIRTILKIKLMVKNRKINYPKDIKFPPKD